MNLPEKYEHWMEIESSYALDKFSAAQQYPYFEEGVARGDFSFMVSAINYLQRARLFARGVRGPDDPVGLQVVQSLGKAANNLVALDATAYSYSHDRKSFVWSEVETFNLLSGVVEVGPAPQTETIASSVWYRKILFEELQRLQDAGDMDMFHTVLDGELLLASNDFVSAAEMYGWVEPGRSSGNISAWNI
jgi:hypothetical protein